MEFFSRALTRYLEWCIQRKTFHAPSSLFFCSWKEKTQAEKIRELREWSGVVSRKQKSVLNFNKRTFLLSNRTARIELLILSALATRKIYDLKVELTKAAGFEDKARNERSSETRRKARLLPETTNFRSISKEPFLLWFPTQNGFLQYWECCAFDLFLKCFEGLFAKAFPDFAERGSGAR